MARRRTSLSVLAERDGARLGWYAPAAALAAHVECYWTLDVAAEHVPVTIHALPDARVDVVVQLASTPPVAYLAGVRESAAAYVHERPVSLLGASLVPSSLPAVFGVRPSALTASWTPLEQVLGASAKGWCAALVSRGSLDERLAFLDTFLASRLLHADIDRRVSRAVDAVEAAQGDIGVAQLGKHAHASSRQLARLFHAWMGMGPKRFARIVRAQAAVRRLGTEVGLAAVAADLGYADQAHLTRELRLLFGSAPMALSRRVARPAYTLR